MVKEGLIYVGTDDGLIQVSQDGGKSWQKNASFPGVPEYTYVSDICPSRFDENVVFASFDNIQRDDFKPYLLKSSDKGSSWSSIVGNLPEKETIHTIIQDPVNADLLFVGTEFSVFFTLDGGKIWIELSSGMPDISVRDLVIQERENDLVAATFGRGFYIIDDYSALRTLNATTLDTAKALIFPVQDALMYVQDGGRYGQGSTVYAAPNPEFGAVFTYYLKEVPQTKKQERLKKEKELFKNGDPIPQPTREQLLAEESEIDPILIFTISDQNNKIVRKLYKNPSEGINRTTWNLRYQGKNPVRLDKNEFNPGNSGNDGMYALPGSYNITLELDHNGSITPLSGPIAFVAKPLENSTLPAADRQALVNYQNKVSELARTMWGTESFLEELTKTTDHIRQALHNTPGAPRELAQKARKISEELNEIEFIFNGTPAKASSEEVPPEQVPLNQRMNTIAYSHWGSTSAPTQTQLKDYDILMEEFPPVLDKIKLLNTQIKEIETEMENYNAPWTPGRIPELKKN